MPISIATGGWVHSDMAAGMSIELTKSDISRSGTSFSTQLGVSVTLGGDPDYPSYWNYDMYCKIGLDGVSSDEIQLKGNGSWTSGGVVSTTYDFKDINVGNGSGSLTAYVFVYSKSDPESCAAGNTIGGNVLYSATNTAPTAPTILLPNFGVFAGKIPLSWSGAADGESDTLHYEVHVDKHDGGGYNAIITSGSTYTGTSYDYDISSHAEGTVYSFGIRAIDPSDAVSEYRYTSGTIKKNTSPPAPTTINVTAGVYDKTIPISWSSVVDPDGQTVHYELEVTVNGFTFPLILDTSNYISTSYDYDITDHAKGSTYSFSVKAIDSMGYKSLATDTGIKVIKKNTSPPAPTTINVTAGVYDKTIPISWSSVVDPEGQIVHYELNVTKNGALESTIISATSNYTSTSYNYDITDHSEGTVYVFEIIAIDSMGYKSPATNTGAKVIKKNTSPPSPTNIYVNPGVYDTVIPISWDPAVDPDGQVVHYILSGTINGAFIFLGIIKDSDNYTSTSYNYDISNHTGGTVYTFNVKAVDSMGYKSTVVDTGIKVIKKNTPPPAPSTIYVNEGIYDKVIPISWDPVVDPEGQSVHYILGLTINGNPTLPIKPASSNYTSTSYNYDISSHDEGTVYTFRLIAVDSVGYQSLAIDTGAKVIKKNKSPYPVSAIYTDTAFAKYGTTVTWLGSSDPDGQNISYTLNIYKNGLLLKAETGLYDTTTYDYTFPEGTTTNSIFTFGVIVKDSMGYVSTETKGGSCVKKLPPADPIHYAPNDNEVNIVYDRKPRIIFKFGLDPNADGQKIYVTWNGIEHNSVDSPELFSYAGSSFMSGQKITFKPTTNGIIGYNIVKIRTNNGYYDSNTVINTISILLVTQMPIVPGISPISTLHINQLKSMVNTLCHSYGLSIPTYYVRSNQYDSVSWSAFIEIQTIITNIISYINLADSSPKFDQPTLWNTDSLFIDSKYIDEMFSKFANL